jgi:hypothetical protein
MGAATAAIIDYGGLLALRVCFGPLWSLVEIVFRYQAIYQIKIKGARSA